MCGPSQSEYGLQEQETGFMNQYQSNYQQRYAGQTGILNNLNNIFSSTIAKGPGQTGFAPAQLAGLNTQAINSTGAANANAQQALGNSIAGQGNSTVQSGVQQALKAGLASQSAGQLASTQQGITQANYAQGTANYNQALAGEGQVAQMENPTAYAGLTQTAQGQAFGQANTINQQNQQMDQEIAGGLTSLGGMALSGGMSGMFGGGGGGGGSAYSVGTGGSYLPQNPAAVDAPNNLVIPGSM
jgi:hypothetical protein